MAVIQLGQTAATQLEALSVTVCKDMKRMRMMSAKVRYICAFCNFYTVHIEHTVVSDMPVFLLYTDSLCSILYFRYIIYTLLLCSLNL